VESFGILNAFTVELSLRHQFCVSLCNLTFRLLLWFSYMVLLSLPSEITTKEKAGRNISINQITSNG